MIIFSFRVVYIEWNEEYISKNGKIFFNLNIVFKRNFYFDFPKVYHNIILT